MQCCFACMQGGGNHAEKSTAKKEKKRKQTRTTPRSTQGDGTEKGVWLGPRDGPRGLGQHGRRHRSEGREREGSDPCEAHKTVPGWMRIQWARATGLLAARWGINMG